MSMEQNFAKRADGNPTFEAYYKVSRGGSGRVSWSPKVTGHGRYHMADKGRSIADVGTRIHSRG